MSKNLLHIKKLPDFVLWLASRGWQPLKLKGDFEVARVTNGVTTVIIYRRIDLKEHYTVPRPFERLVRDFIKETKND